MLKPRIVEINTNTYTTAFNINPSLCIHPIIGLITQLFIFQRYSVIIISLFSKSNDTGYVFDCISWYFFSALILVIPFTSLATFYVNVYATVSLNRLRNLLRVSQMTMNSLSWFLSYVAFLLLACFWYCGCKAALRPSV